MAGRTPSRPEPLTLERAIHDFGWLGPVVAIHLIGRYSIVEYWCEPASNSEDRSTYRAFGAYIDNERVFHSFNSMDEALAGCVARRHDGRDTRADWYFIRSIGADLPPEAQDGDAATIAAERGSSLTEVNAEFLAALKNIFDLTKPGQTVNVSQATDIICDVWNAARAAIAKAEGGAS